MSIPLRFHMEENVLENNNANTAVGHLRIAMLAYRGKPHVGGQGVYVREMSKALVELGHSVEVFGGPPYPDLDPKVPLHEFLAKKIGLVCWRRRGGSTGMHQDTFNALGDAGAALHGHGKPLGQNRIDSH